MCPRVHRQWSGSEDDRVGRSQRRSSTRRTGVVRGSLQQVVIVATFVDHVPPSARDRGRIDPRFQRHAVGQVERSSVRNTDQRVRSIEEECFPKLARRRPSRVHDRSGITLSGEVCDGCAGTFIEAIRSDQSAWRRLRCCAGHVGVETEISSSIRGSHSIAITRTRGEPSVAESRSGRSGNLRKGRASRALTSFQQVTRDAHVVGSGGPSQVDLRAARRAGSKVGWRRGWLSVGRLSRSRSNIGISAKVPCRIGGTHAIAVADASCEAGAVERCTDRASDL